MMTIAFKEEPPKTLAVQHKPLSKRNLTHIRFPSKEGLRLIPLKTVVCLQAERNYTRIITEDNGDYLLAKTLKNYEVLASEDGDFIRVHKSYIIRKNVIKSYLVTGELLLTHLDFVVPVSRRRRAEVLRCINQTSI